MPSRVISLAILVYWSIAAFCLLTWDVLPELTHGLSARLAGNHLRQRFASAGTVEYPGRGRSPVAGGAACGG